MFVLPEPVTPCRSLVFVVASSRAFRACFWTVFKGMLMDFRGFSGTVAAILCFLPIVLGRKRLTTCGKGTR